MFGVKAVYRNLKFDFIGKKMKRIRNLKKGFTLLELIIVIAIMSVLAAVIIPQVTGYIKQTQIATDTANVRVLNSVTQLYRLEDLQNDGDPFSGLTTDTARMQTLISHGYLSNTVVPLQNDIHFTWQISIQQWIMESSRIPTVLDGVVMGTGGHLGYLKGAYTGSQKDVVMSLTLNGVNITHVYQDVFNGKGLTSLYFDPSAQITEIHARAFNNNTLTELVLPNSIKKLDYGAFNNNPITTITIGSGVIFETNVFQNNNKFRDAYYAQGAGTYIYESGNWVKQ